jgi:hypothetical protein
MIMIIIKHNRHQSSSPKFLNSLAQLLKIIHDQMIHEFSEFSQRARILAVLDIHRLRVLVVAVEVVVNLHVHVDARVAAVQLNSQCRCKVRSV